MAVTKKQGTAAKVATGTKAKKSTDLIFSTAQEVENLSAAKAFSLIDTLSEDIESNSFKLGGALSVVLERSEGGDAEWLGDSKSFRELVGARFGMHYRKAMYLIGIYRNLVEKQIPWSSVSGIGWTKIALLAPILTQKNTEKWVEKAKKLTYPQLADVVKNAKTKGRNATEDEGDSNITTLTFKLKKDQKEVVKEAIEKAKAETKTEFDSVAIANIATGYLGGSVEIATTGGEDEDKPAKKQTKKEKKEALKVMLLDLGLEDSLAVVEEAFPDATIDVTV